MTLDELRALATVTRDDGFTSWAAQYDMSVTLEDAEFLYALVRLTKPSWVLEIGTGKGVSGRFIAEALEDNAYGSLMTVETNDTIRTLAQELLAGTRAVVTDYVETDISWDIVFIDSGYERREADIELWTIADHHALVVVHDANRDYPQLRHANGVFLPGSDGLWLGRSAEQIGKTP